LYLQHDDPHPWWRVSWKEPVDGPFEGDAAVVFVEKANRALRILRDNLALLDEEDLDYEVVRGNAWDRFDAGRGSTAPPGASEGRG